MIMNVLVATSLVCQIVLVSILLPRKLVLAAKREISAQSAEAGFSRALRTRYLLINYSIAALALLGLLACAALHSSGAVTMTVLLLSIGIAFLAQVSPLAILLYHRAMPLQLSNRRASEQKSIVEVPRLFAILPLAPVLVAAVLYLAYVSTLGVIWIQSGANPLPKIVALTFTNLLCIIAVLWSYRRLVTETDERAERYSELIRMGPILIFASILVTIYFFAKEVLFTLDLHQARPIMMSAALQLVALAVFYVVSGKGDRAIA